MLFALRHAAGVVFLGSLFWATGYLIGALLRDVEVRALGSFLVRTTTGVIAWICLLFLCASVGLFRASVALPLAALVLAAAAGRIALRAKRSPPWPELRERLRARGAWHELALKLLAAALPSLILTAIFFHALSPHLGWDDDVYHLTLPKLYVAEGGFRRVPFNVYSNWPHAVELLFGLAMMVDDYVLAKLVHPFFLVLIVLAVFRICRHRTSRALAVFATLLVLGNPVLLFEAERAYTDIAFAFFLLVAVACAIEHLQSEACAPLALAGLCCGALAGSKLSGLAGLPCVLLIVLARRPFCFDRQRLRMIALCLVLPMIALAVPWYIKSYLYTGNPFYPFLFRFFGGVEWDAGLAEQFMNWQRSIGMGRSLHDYLALPLRVIVDGAPGYARFDGQVGRFWIVAVPLSMLGAWFVQSPRPYLFCAGAYFVFWALASQQLRFLIAVLPLLAIATSVAIAWICDRLRARAARVALGVALAAGASSVLLPILYPSCEQAVTEAKNLIRSGPLSRSAVVPEGYAFINANTPPTSKIMLLNTNHGFFLGREYVADSFFEASQMNSVVSQAKSEEQLAAILRQLGLTHVYVWQDEWGIPYPALLWSFLRDRHHAEVAYRCHDGYCTLYALRD